MIAIRKEGPVAVLTLDRPEHANSIDMEMADRLIEVALRCENDTSIRCVLLAGSGKAFCAGGDLGSFSQHEANLPAYLAELAGKVHMAQAHLMRMPKPLVTMVNGAAAGAGLGLALSGDIVLAGSSAKFVPAYSGVGLTSDAGLTWLLPHLIGLRKAQEMIFLNRRVDAEEAKNIGLVTQVVPDAELEEQAMAVAGRLAQSAIGAIGKVRELLLAGFDGPLEGHLEREARTMSAAAGGPETREGVRAFLAGEKPDFMGKGQ